MTPREARMKKASKAIRPTEGTARSIGKWEITLRNEGVRREAFLSSTGPELFLVRIKDTRTGKALLCRHVFLDQALVTLKEAGLHSI